MRTKTTIVTTFASVILSVPLLAQNGNNGTQNGNSLPNQIQNQLPQNGQDQNRQNGTGYGQNGSNGNDNGNRNGAVLPAGTRINVRLDHSAGNSGDRQGGLLPASLVDDISVNGRVIASAGTRVQTRMSSGSNDSSSLRLDSMQLNGQNYRLSSDSVPSNGNGFDRNRDGSNNGNGSNNNNGSNDGNRRNSSNESGLQKLGDLIGQGTNQGNNQNDNNNQQGNGRDRQSGDSVYHFRLTSASRPSGNNR